MVTNLNCQSILKPFFLSRPQLVFLTTLILCSSCAYSVIVAPSLSAAQAPIDVELLDGFEIKKLAGNDLVPDAFCLTLAPDGNPVVAGPGYVRRLEDFDGDGQFEKAVELLDGKINGAQGLCFVGKKILCTANGGLNLCAPSSEGNSATVKRLFEITTGGEHHAHAIRIGPDGWVYVLAGNQTEILPLYYSGLNSPVKNPQAGFLMRFKLVGESCERFEIVCDGFRNAYDFDFGPDGSIFVYDSDGERDISLPWYRPTRVFRMRAGDNAGWVSASWKRPSYYFDMPETVAKLGRGSPTGVAMNPFHLELGNRFGGRVFVGDWTFGRIASVSATSQIDSFGKEEKLSPSLTQISKRHTSFAIARGQFGFAVTDLEFESAYELLVTVGGRGTEGALFRIRNSPAGITSGEGLKLSTEERTAKRFRALKLESIDDPAIENVTKALANKSVVVRVAALESLVGHHQFLRSVSEENRRAFTDSLSSLLSDEELSPTMIRLSQRLVSQLSESERDSVLVKVPDSRRLLLLGASDRRPDTDRVELLKKFILARDEAIEQIVFVRAAQLVLGGCEGEGMFAGYTAKNPLAGDLILDRDKFLNLSAFDQESRYEAGRLAAMMTLESATFRSQLVEQLTDESDPIDDIHWLNCIAKTRGELDAIHVARIASCLCRVRAALRERELPTDRNWIPRMQELTRESYKIPGVATEVVESDLFGQSDQAFLFEGLVGESTELAQENFAAVASSDPSAVSKRQLEIVAANPVYKPVLRQFKQHESLFDVVVNGLSIEADSIDRPVFAQGLASWNMATVKRSAVALRRLGKPRVDSAQLTTEFRNALQTARRIGFDNQAVSVRDQIVLYFRSVTGREFGYLERQPNPSSEIQARQVVAIEKWTRFLTEKFNFEIAAPLDSSKLLTRLESIDFSISDAERGREVFVKRQCATCHDADRGTKLGPPLNGIVNRFSRRDVFEAIIHPHAQVPDRYRAILVATEDGVVHKGTVIYESVDGITLMDIEGKTLRINKNDIDQRKRLDQSLMPSGLFDGISDQDTADFWSYVETLK